MLSVIAQTSIIGYQQYACHTCRVGLATAVTLCLRVLVRPGVSRRAVLICSLPTPNYFAVVLLWCEITSWRNRLAMMHSRLLRGRNTAHSYNLNDIINLLRFLIEWFKLFVFSRRDNTHRHNILNWPSRQFSEYLQHFGSIYKWYVINWQLDYFGPFWSILDQTKFFNKQISC